MEITLTQHAIMFKPNSPLILGISGETVAHSGENVWKLPGCTSTLAKLDSSEEALDALRKSLRHQLVKWVYIDFLWRDIQPALLLSSFSSIGTKSEEKTEIQTVQVVNISVRYNRSLRKIGDIPGPYVSDSGFKVDWVSAQQLLLGPSAAAMQQSFSNLRG